MIGLRDYSEKERAWLWLSGALGTSVAAADRLLYLNNGLDEAFSLARSGKALRLPENIDERRSGLLTALCSDRAIDAAIRSMNELGIYAVTRDSEDYPALLREIYDPPMVLYVKGRLPKNITLPIAVIGSRRCSDYGREMAVMFGKSLADNGACVISGLAVGCDSEAAKGALASSAECSTVAVMGGGVDVIYPDSSKKLYYEIAERGAIVSEFRPGRKPTRESFPQRNRIISGMAKGLLVIEAGKKSGTSITVDFAHEQGRDVFAVPGRLNDLMSAGTNGLIKNGEAKAVFDVDDILCEYGLFTVRAERMAEQKAQPRLSGPQRSIFDLLTLGEKTIDELCAKTGFSVSEINSYLTELELSGIIKQLTNGEYALAR